MRFLAALAIGAVLAAGEAQAQPAPWQPERGSAGWTFTPSLAFGTYWDSNVTIRNEGSPRAEEWVGLLNPRGEFDYNGRRTKFNSGYSGSLYAYRRFEELTRYDQRARLSLRYQASPRLLLNTSHSATMTPTTDDQDLAGLPYLRLGSQLYTGRGGLAYGLGNRTSMSAEYTFQWIRFDPNADVELSRLRGGYSNGGGLSLTHRLDERLSVGGSYSFVMSEQTTRNLSAQVQRAQAQAGWRLGPSTGISGGAGLSHIYVPETGRDVTGPAYSASIGHQAGRVSLNASYDEAYVATITLGSAQAHRGVTGSASMPLRRGRMHLAGAVGYRKTHPVIGSDGIGLETLSVSGTLGMNATRWLRAELFYNGNFQQSTARGKYDRTRIGVQFVTFKPVRIQ